MARRHETEDEAYDRYVQEIMDDEVEAREEEARRNAAKRAASGISAELLSLQQAFVEGQRAGMLGLTAGLNPYDHAEPESEEWERARAAIISARLRYSLRKTA